MYALLFSPLSPAQWEALEIFQPVTLRVCLEMLRFALNMGVLLEAQTYPSRLQAEAQALEHVQYFHSPLSLSDLLADNLFCPQFQIWLFVQNFMAVIGVASFLPPPLQSHPRKPLDVHPSISYIGRTTTIAAAGIPQLALERLAQDFCDYPQVSTDSSVNPVAHIATLAFVILASSKEHSGRLGFCASFYLFNRFLLIIPSLVKNKRML